MNITWPNYFIIETPCARTISVDSHYPCFNFQHVLCNIHFPRWGYCEYNLYKLCYRMIKFSGRLSKKDMIFKKIML